MTQTVIQRMFVPFKKYLPSWIYNIMRSIGTVFLGPIRFGYETGFFLSSFKMAAVSKDGKPIPWYTYPCIDFLRFRKFDGKKILEFGGGQSTLWWAERARNVITLEGDKNWYEKIKNNMPENVQLHYVSMESREINVSEVNLVLDSIQNPTYDVIVIDGLFREEMISIALRLIAEDGIIIFDNSEGYGCYEGFKETTEPSRFFWKCSGGNLASLYLTVF